MMSRPIPGNAGCLMRGRLSGCGLAFERVQPAEKPAALLKARRKLLKINNRAKSDFHDLSCAAGPSAALGRIARPTIDT